MSVAQRTSQAPDEKRSGFENRRGMLVQGIRVEVVDHAVETPRRIVKSSEDR